MSAFEPISRGHAGFINILHVGRTAEYLYYSMELADDHLDGRKIDIGSYEPRTLKTDLARHKRLSADESIRLGLSLTEALEALHKRGLTHRDIKPSNIIFSENMPKLADIGLVAPADSVHSLARKVTSRRKGRARRAPTFTVWANFFTKPAPEKTGSIFRRSIRN
jgi:Serine/threonine protein kinase